MSDRTLKIPGKSGGQLRGLSANVPLHFILKVALVTAMAALLGIGSANLAVRYGTGFGGIEIGPWRTYPRLGTFDVDPYAHAAIIRRNELPLGTGEGQFFAATTDTSGLPLNSRCTYAIDGILPLARAWSLTAHRIDGGLFATAHVEPALTSGIVIYSKNNDVTITVSHAPQPLNWLPLPENAAFSLVFRLYDSATNLAALSRQTVNFPSIARIACQ